MSFEDAKVSLQREFNQLGEEIQKLAMTRQTLSLQLNENEGVREEFALLSADAVIFREIGPALVKADTADAKALVDGRVDMITKDLKKIEALVEEKGKRRLEVQTNYQKLLQKEEADRQAAAATAAGGNGSSAEAMLMQQQQE